MGEHPKAYAHQVFVRWGSDTGNVYVRVGVGSSSGPTGMPACPELKRRP